MLSQIQEWRTWVYLDLVCTEISESFTFMWPCIITNFFVIKPTRCTNFTNLFCHETTCFGQFVCPSSGVYSLYTQQWRMSYKYVNSFRAGPGWNSWSSILVLLESCLQICMAFTIAEWSHGLMVLVSLLFLYWQQSFLFQLLPDPVRVEQVWMSWTVYGRKRKH